MVQEVTTNSFGSRIMGALWGVLFGIVMIAGAFYLVFWNEGHGLHRAQALAQVHKNLVSVAAAPINPSNNMAVIYVSGLATTNDILNDKLFNVSEKAIQLNRHVEMYQWKEEQETRTEKNYGGSETQVKTYTYKQVWSPQLINSADFKESGHHNPTSMPIMSNIQYAKEVTLGDFSLPPDLISEISGNTIVELDKADVEALKLKFNKPVSNMGGGLYVGESSDQPKIGDMRISMTMVLPQTVSIIAQQAGNTLQPFMAPSGSAVSLLDMGQVSPDQMIHAAEVENQIMTWILRLVSLLLMMIGFGLIMKPVAVLADVIPFFGSLVGFGTGLIAFVLGLGCWSVSVAVAWFAVRPMWSLGIVIITALICYWVYTRKKTIVPAK